MMSSACLISRVWGITGLIMIIIFSIYIAQINIQEDMIKCALQSNGETNIPNKHKVLKNPNWREADQ